MTKRLLLPLVAACTLALCAGCLFPKNFSKEKKDKHVAASLEKEFRQRWVEKRVADLTATGVNTTVAEAQANTEYDAKYSYAEPTAKK